MLFRSRTILQATGEVATPTIFGIMIIILVFLPLMTLQGIEGKLFSPLALTIAIALFVSLVVSLLLSEPHAASTSAPAATTIPSRFAFIGYSPLEFLPGWQVSGERNAKVEHSNGRSTVNSSPIGRSPRADRPD